MWRNEYKPYHYSVLTTSVVYVIKKPLNIRFIHRRKIIMKRNISKKFIFIFFIVILIFPLLFISCSKSPSALYEEGRQYYKNKQYDEALSSFNELIKKQKDFKDVYYQRGLCYLELGQLDDAKNDFARTLKGNPDHLYSLIKRARIYLKKDNMDKTLADLKRAVKIDPENSRANNYMGEYYYRIKQPDKAMKYYEKALKKESGYSRALGNMAVYYAEVKKEHFIAEEYIKKALSLDSKSGELNRIAGNIMISIGDYKKAGEYYNDAVGKDPGNVNYYLARAVFFARYKGDYKKAVEDLNKALKIDPKNAMVFLERGIFEMEGWGNTDKALADIDEALKLDKGLARAYYYRGLIYLEKKKDYKKAVENLNKAIELEPETASAYYTRSIAYSAWGKNKEAQADFIKALEIDPDVVYSKKFGIISGKDGINPVTKYLAQGEVFLNGKNYSKALESFNSALKSEPENPDVLFFRAKTYLLKNEFNEALEDLKKAVKIKPDFLPAYLLSSSIYFQMDKTGEAIKGYNEILKKRPDEIIALTGRGNVYALGKKDYKKALADFNKVIEVAPNYSIAYFFKGKTCMKLGKKKEALKALKKFISIAPEQYKAHKTSALNDIKKIKKSLSNK